MTVAATARDPRENTTGWTEAEQQEADLLQIEGARLYRTLTATLRRSPTPRELHRAREAFFGTPAR